jgi:2-dehydro-3-deoxygluconokinase
MKTLDIVAIGEAMVEFNQQSDGGFVMSCGGDTSNCVIAAARMGAKTGYISRLGMDQFGTFLRAQWATDGVDSSHVINDIAASTGLYFVTHEGGTHEFTYRRAGSAASLITEGDLPLAYIADAKILHVSGISQAISPPASQAVLAAIRHAKASGTMVSYDTNLRLKLWDLNQARQTIHAAMALADIARPSLDDARLLTGLEEPNAIADYYMELGAGTVALTLGSNGAMIATPAGRKIIAPVSVTSVDATGAGDAFGGAFLAGLARGLDPFASARLANVAAAISTTRYGAVNSIPYFSEVETFLAVS